jgi:FKBP-type peptidyl-prolyl cis-trans isomerase FkpA
MRKIAYLFLATAVLFSACKDASFKKGEEGIEYKIIADGKGDLLKQGEFMEVHFTSTLSGGGKKDSILNSSRDQGGAQIMPFDSTNLPPAYFKIFKQLKKGDSVATRTSTDTIIKKQQPGQELPAFIKKGMFIYTNIKLVNIYKTQAEADSARKLNMAAAEVAAKAKAEALVKEDDKTIAAYLAKNNIKATKTAKGVYIEVKQAGTGALLDSTVFAKVMYTGKTLNGVMFDSNVDPSKGHTDPLNVNLTNDMSLGGGVIPGMTDALKTMQKGTKATMYIPSGLAYGPRAQSADLPANANLIFDVEIIDVMTVAQAKADNAAQQAKMIAKQKAAQAEQMAAQKKYMDSLKKADPKAAEEMQKQMMQQQMQQMQQQQGGGQR